MYIWYLNFFKFIKLISEKKKVFSLTIIEYKIQLRFLKDGKVSLGKQNNPSKTHVIIPETYESVNLTWQGDFANVSKWRFWISDDYSEIYRWPWVIGLLRMEKEGGRESKEDTRIKERHGDMQVCWQWW